MGGPSTRGAAPAGPPPPCLDWEREGADWPNRSASRFVRAGGIRWHVQTAGEGPSMLLVHGTGSASHSWQGLLPLLARHFHVIAPDLPGHGFTELGSVRDLTLPGLARAVGSLLAVLDRAPELALGHSAGAAIACRLSLDGAIAPRALIGVNAALWPLEGLPGLAFPFLAYLLGSTIGVPWLMARRARNPRVVGRLLRDSGSKVSHETVRRYAQCAGSIRHSRALLGMLARWDLRALVRDLPSLRQPLFLLVGERDRFVAPARTRESAAHLPDVEVFSLGALGHLAHEEEPETVAGAIREIAGRVGIDIV